MASRRDAEIRVLITGDASGASRAFRQMASDAQSAGTITKTQAQSIGRALDDLDRKASGLNLTKLTDAARVQGLSRVNQAAGGGAIGGLLGDLGGAEQVLGGISTKAAVAAGGVAAIGVAAVTAGKASIEQFQSVGASVGKLQQTLGVSAEEASRFWFALQASGVNPEQGLDAINQFAVNISQNADDLKRFGVELEKNDRGFTDIQGTLVNVIDEYQRLSKAGENAAAAQLLSVSVGEEGMRQLQPLLRRGADAFEELGGQARNVLTEDELATLDDYNAAMGALRGQMQLAAAQVGSELAPGLTALASAAADVAPIAGEVGGTLVDIAGVVFSPVVDGLRAVGQAASWAAEKSGDLADSLGRAVGSGTVGDALGNVGVAAARIAADSARAADGLYSVGFAQAQVAQALPAYQDAVSKIAGAHNDARVASAALADAEQDAAQSISSANQQAAEQVASANQRLADAHQAAAEASADLAAAERDAARTIADANERAAKMVEDAERRLSDARESRAEAVDDLRRAEIDAAERIADANVAATERVVSAQERLADARERAQRTQTDNARRLEDAEVSLQDAYQRALKEDDTGQALRIRELAQREFQRTREDVAEAEQDAAENVQDAEQDLSKATVDAEKQRATAAEQAAEQIDNARKRVSAATRGVAEAERALTDAAQQADRARADAAEQASSRIQSARARVSSANAAVSQAEVNLQNTMLQAEASRAAAAEQASARVVAARQREAQAAQLATMYDQIRNRELEKLVLFNSMAGNPLPYGEAAARIASVKARASGGPVTAGGMYLVGERGPELLQMGAATGYMHSAGSGSAAPVVINNYAVISNEQQLVELLERARRAGSIGGR